MIPTDIIDIIADKDEIKEEDRRIPARISPPPPKKKTEKVRERKSRVIVIDI